MATATKVTQSLPASGANDLMRLTEAQALASGCAPLVHTHVAAQVTDFAAAVGILLEGIPAATSSLSLGYAAGRLTGGVIVDPNGGLASGVAGLGCNFGAAANTVAMGNHTHAQLHDALVLGSSVSISFNLADQTLGGEVNLAPGGGLQAQPSGVACNWGTAANTVAMGNHTHAQLHPALTTYSTAGLALYLNATAQTLSGVVNLDPSPASGFGQLAHGSAGLSVMLGTAANTAAAGNHGHAAATTCSNGFMSMTDKQALGTLASGVAGTGFVHATAGAFDGARLVKTSDMDPLGLPKDAWRFGMDNFGATMVSGGVTYFVAPYSGVVTGWDVITDTAGSAGTWIYLDVLAGTFAGFPPVLSITGGNGPFASGVQAAQNLSPSGWSMPVAENTAIGVKILNVAGIKRASLQLRVLRV
jgi:hypothetical protein